MWWAETHRPRFKPWAMKVILTGSNYNLIIFRICVPEAVEALRKYIPETQLGVLLLMMKNHIHYIDEQVENEELIVFV